jgi:hypothetical protein
MTTAADDRAVEEAFEASLAGRAVPGEAAGLAAFTRAVRGTATQPGRPNAALAELLSTGLLTDQSSPSTRTAPAAGPLPSRRSRSRTRRRFTVIVPALIAKFLSAGAVAQAATGAGVVVVVVTGAGTAGVLPEDAQETFSDLTGINETVEEPTDDLTEVTEPVDDGELADPTEVPEVEVPESEETESESEDGELTAEAWAENGPAVGQSFGEWVAQGANNGWVKGAIVSDWAHKRNEARKAARDGVEEIEDAEETEAPEVEDGTEDGQESEVESTDDGDDSGKGKGRGKGRGGRD